MRSGWRYAVATPSTPGHGAAFLRQRSGPHTAASRDWTPRHRDYLPGWFPKPIPGVYRALNSFPSVPAGSTGTPGRVTDTALLLAAVLSIGAIALALVRAGSGANLVSVAAVILSVLASMLSWALVNLPNAGADVSDAAEGATVALGEVEQRDPPR